MTVRFATGPVLLDDDGEGVRRDVARLLGETIGVEVEAKAYTSYGELVEAVVTGEAAIAWLPPAAYVRAAARREGLRLFAAQRLGGGHYHSALFVRRDSGHASVESLRGRHAAWVDHDSCAGFLFPFLQLQKEGFDVEALFGTQRFLQSHGRVVQAVQRGEVDCGATYVQKTESGELTLVGWAPFVPAERMRAILVSEAIPADVLVSSLDSAQHAKLSEVFLRPILAPRFGRAFRALMNADRFSEGDDAAFSAVRAALQLVGGD